MGLKLLRGGDRDGGPDTKNKTKTKTDQLIRRAVSQTFRPAWTTGWTAEDRLSCKNDAHQEAQAWLLLHPDATELAIQKQANRGAEKIRREFRKHVSVAPFEHPDAQNYHSNDDTVKIAPWDDIRVKGLSQAPDWKKVQIMGTGSIEAIDLNALALRMATTPKRPLWPNELTQKELKFFYDYIVSFSPAPLNPPGFAALKIDLAARGMTLDMPEVGRVERDVTLELDFYEEHARDEWPFVKKYTDTEGAHSERDKKRFQRLKSRYFEQYEKLYWQNLAYTYWTMTHDPETGERSTWWEKV
jgi:hypothetical protein